MMSGYRVHRKDRFFRKVVSFILKMVILIRHGYYIRDANCPYKMFTKNTLKFLLKKLPKDCSVPSICLEILARRYKFSAVEIPVEHYPYHKNRTGTLQSINKKSLKVFWRAFMEVIRV
jgi:hypothetical protein